MVDKELSNEKYVLIYRMTRLICVSAVVIITLWKANTEEMSVLLMLLKAMGIII